MGQPQRVNILPTERDTAISSLKPMYEGQSSMDCEYLKGGKCYSDGSGLNARSHVADFIMGGTKWLWPFLEDYYREVFGRAKKQG